MKIKYPLVSLSSSYSKISNFRFIETFLPTLNFYIKAFSFVRKQASCSIIVYLRIPSIIAIESHVGVVEFLTRRSSV